jgi:rubrerythrin
MASDSVSLETLALWFSNYSSLAGKALRMKLAEEFGKMARSLETRERERSGVKAPVADRAGLLAAVDSLVKDSIATGYPRVKDTAGANRGALRAFTWGSKVATILKSVVARVSTKGDAVLGDGQSFFVCDGCGFIFIGSAPPDICPVCKAPASRFAAY